MYTDEEILDALRDTAGRLGHSPSFHEWERLHLRPATTTIANRFGWSNALLLAGLEPGSDLSHAKLDETATLIKRQKAGESLTRLGKEIGITGQALGRRIKRYERLAGRR